MISLVPVYFHPLTYRTALYYEVMFTFMQQALPSANRWRPLPGSSVNGRAQAWQLSPPSTTTPVLRTSPSVTLGSRPSGTGKMSSDVHLYAMDVYLIVFPSALVPTLEMPTVIVIWATSPMMRMKRKCISTFVITQVSNRKQLPLCPATRADYRQKASQ